MRLAKPVFSRGGGALIGSWALIRAFTVTLLSLKSVVRDALQNLKRAFIPSCHAQQTKRKREYSWSNRDSVLWKTKALCGTTSLRVTVLALFYESVKRGTKTIKKSKKQQLQQIGQMK